MRVIVNERPCEYPDGTLLADVRHAQFPDADVLVVNGFPAPSPHVALADGDRVALIRRGAIPTAGELAAVMVARHTPGVHERVREARVGIAGVGGLGSAVAIALARTGVGTLVIADHDVVEPSNLNRQQYFADQLGEPKVVALADTLRRVNPFVRVEPHESCVTADNAARIFGGVDVLVEAFDRPEAKAMLVTAFLAAFPHVPVVAASGMAGHGPAEEIRVRRSARNLWVVGDGETAAAPGVGLMAPRVGVAAHSQANAVLRLLLGDEPA